MDQEYYSLVITLFRQDPFLSNFDLFSIGFIGYFVTKHDIGNIFANVNCLVDLNQQGLLSEPGKVNALVEMLVKKLDPTTLRALVPAERNNSEVASFFEEYFLQIAEIIPKYTNLWKIHMFFLGYFQAACPSYLTSEFLEVADNISIVLAEEIEDEENNLISLLQSLDQQLAEARNKGTTLILPKPHKQQPESDRLSKQDSSQPEAQVSANANQNENQSHRNRREDLEETKEARPPKMAKSIEERKNDALPEGVDLKKLSELPRVGATERMTTVEETALSKAFIEKLLQEEEKEAETRRKQISQQDTVNCVICLDELYSNAFRPLEVCSHVFHDECMKEYLKLKIDSKDFPMTCPEVECKKDITLADIKDLLDESYLDKFVTFSFKSYLEKNANEVSCCPTPDCSFAFVKEDGQIDIKCPVCKKHYCLNCRVIWHANITCQEYQISHTKSEDDMKFEEFVKGQQFKQCPRCGFWVSKTEGCTAMICRCNAQFCYVCGKEGDGHHCPCYKPPERGLFGRGRRGARGGQGLFGNGNNDNGNRNNVIENAPRPAQLFGNNRGNGLFGNNNNNNRNNNLFGNNHGNGLFGNNNNNMNNNMNNPFGKNNGNGFVQQHYMGHGNNQGNNNQNIFNANQGINNPPDYNNMNNANNMFGNNNGNGFIQQHYMGQGNNQGNNNQIIFNENQGNNNPPYLFNNYQHPNNNNLNRLFQ